MRFFKPKYMGIFFIISSIALFSVFQFYIVEAANSKLPNGNYTELHGLVSSCRIYIYTILAVVFAGGIINLFVPQKPKEKTDKNEDAENSK